jgi:hypothetical protein
LSDPRYAQTGKEEKISTTSITSDQAARASVSVSTHQLADPISKERHSRKGNSKGRQKSGIDLDLQIAFARNGKAVRWLQEKKEFNVRLVSTSKEEIGAVLHVCDNF